MHGHPPSITVNPVAAGRAAVVSGVHDRSSRRQAGGALHAELDLITGAPHGRAPGILTTCLRTTMRK